MLESGNFLIFGLATVSTVLLLGIGCAVGHYFGRQCVAGVAPNGKQLAPDSRPLTEAHCELSQMSRKLRSEAAALSEILADHRQTVPRALACAIERLVVTSSRLAKHVQAVNDLQPAFNQPAQVAQPWIPLTPVQQVCLPPADSRISSTGTGTLTPEEMRSFGAADGGAAAEDDDFSKQRYSYDCLQTVVPKFDGIASAARAARVRCHEISAQGVSFFWPGVPDFERAIISLGLERDPIFMRAEVAQSKAVFMHNELQVLVETRFTGRYESSSQRKTTLPAIVSSNSDAELAFAASP